MEEIAKLLIELLKTHNRVSLPGMGAFVATIQPASIDKDKKVMLPPSKKITFVKSETWNDGLLEQAYAEKHELSIDDARKEVRNVISDIRFDLDAIGKVTLPGLGTLKQAQSRSIDFGLNKKLNLNEEAFGLEEIKIDTPENMANKKSKKQKKNKHHILLLILLGLIIATILVLTLYMLLSRSRDNYETLNLIEARQVQVTIPVVDSSAPAVQPQEKHEEKPAAATTTPAPSKPAEQKPAQTAAAKSQPSVAPTPRCEYCIVMASLTTRKEAEAKSEEYKKLGYKSSVVDGGNNRFRVTYGCYPTREAAKEQQPNAIKKVKDAWILEVCK